jgi:alkyl hydroperoxide reductase subunit F
MKVKVFTTKDCKYCPSVKKYLDSIGKKYEVVDCSANPDAIQEVYELSGVLTVPQTVCYNGDETIVIVGVNYGKLAKLP